MTLTSFSFRAGRLTWFCATLFLGSPGPALLPAQEAAKPGETPAARFEVKASRTKPVADGSGRRLTIQRVKLMTSGVRLNGTTATWTKEFEFLPSGGGYSPSYYDYQDASKVTAPVAIKWGVCWFYKKGMISGLDSDNPPTYAKFDGWRTWDATTTRYNGGGVDNYTERVNRAMKEGRHPSNANLYIWPLKSNKKARGNP